MCLCARSRTRRERNIAVDDNAPHAAIAIDAIATAVEALAGLLARAARLAHDAVHRRAERALRRGSLARAVV